MIFKDFCMLFYNLTFLLIISVSNAVLCHHIEMVVVNICISLFYPN